MKENSETDKAMSVATSILGILVAEMPTSDKANENARAMKNCPRLLACGTTSKVFVGVFMLPHDMEWWLRIPEEKPELLGAEKVSISIADHISYPEEFYLHMPEEIGEESPCGTNCANCPQMDQVGCRGCPATIHYRQ